MKDLVLILSESHLPPLKSDGKAIYQVVTAWLTEKLQK